MHIRFMFKNVAGRRHVTKRMQDALSDDASEEYRWLPLNQWHRASGDEAKAVVDAFKSNPDGVVWADDKQGHRPTEKSMEQQRSTQSLSKLAIDERRDGLDTLAAFAKAIKKRSAEKEKAAADAGRKPAKKSASQKSEPKPTHASLEDFASGLERERRGRYGDGVPTGEPRRSGSGLYEASMRRGAPLAEGIGFELVYSTGGGGGSGGPYSSLPKAKDAAARRLAANKNERWIAIIDAKDTANLTKAKALWVLKQGGDWVKGPQPLPNINPLKHLQAQDEGSEALAAKIGKAIAEAVGKR